MEKGVCVGRGIEVERDRENFNFMIIIKSNKIKFKKW